MGSTKTTCFPTEARPAPATTVVIRKMALLDSGATLRMLKCVGKSATCLLAVSHITVSCEPLEKLNHLTSTIGSVILFYKSVW